jgi:hypothetical protein
MIRSKKGDHIIEDILYMSSTRALVPVLNKNFSRDEKKKTSMADGGSKEVLIIMKSEREVKIFEELARETKDV